MTTPSKSPHRSIATLHLARSVPALITQAQNIVQAVAGNPAFPSPTPPLASITDAIQKLQAAETATLSRTKGAATLRDEKRNVLTEQLEQLRHHVQTVANASPETSASTIESAGIGVKRTPVHPKRVFTAKPGAVSGAVTLMTQAAARRASYVWQFSSDAGKTWVDAPITLQSKTTVSGLTPGAAMVFRCRPVTKDGAGDWSQPSWLIVK